MLIRLKLWMILLVVFAVGADGQSPLNGTLRVRVYDPAGRPIAHVHGRLSGPGGVRVLETANDGSLLVDDLAAGRYTLLLTNRGFASTALPVVMTQGDTVAREVRLLVAGESTSVTVIASTPIGSLDLPLTDVPSPVQSISAKTIEDTNAMDLTEVLKRRMNGVYVNENQNNPFQPDVNYRGYTASPLVGSAVGLSVYLDGVRQNQPFGDVVSWDLIPRIAIQTTDLVPGSNPLYGLNTLGGAIVVQTKDGISNSGVSVSGYGGSYGRRAVDMEYGGSKAAWNWFAAGTLFHEDGWRVQSPSSVKQSFAKLGYVHDDMAVWLSGGYAINDLLGNGTQDFRAIERGTGLNHGYSSVYSVPDATDQHQPFLTLNVTESLGPHFTVNGNAYVRYTRSNTTNGDINDNSFDQSLYTLSAADKAALTKAGIPFPSTPITPENTPFPYLRCIAQSLELDEPGEKCTGVVTDTVNRQHAYGVSGVVGWSNAHHRLAVGAGWDGGSLTFQQTGQYGYLNTDGISITRVGAFVDGSTNVDGVPQDNRVNLHSATRTPSVFFSDTINYGRWVLNVGGRYNHVTVDNSDRLPPVSYRGTLTSLNTFQRFNPTAGVIYKTASLDAYFDYSESSRAPTSTELGCADPEFPCSLPNALVSDPALKQVVSRTFEFGVRRLDGRVRWNAGYFHAGNDDDLLFVASETTGYGYFRNFGRTERQGVEAGLAIHTSKVDAGAGYTFLQATYQSAETIESDGNSSNSNALSGLRGVTEGGLITIVPGDHIPQVPQQMMKLFADYHPLRRLFIDADLNLIGGSYVRGNENNLHQPDGVYYLGKGTTPGYGVVNLGVRYKFSPHYEMFAEINNLLNRQYYTAGQLASTPYDDAGKFTARPFPPYPATPGGDVMYPLRSSTFVAPGAPVIVFGGLKVTFGKR
jgi:outer membrane receptor protein involved in Fe transport